MREWKESENDIFAFVFCVRERHALISGENCRKKEQSVSFY